jgi:AcrR family transcriptional regulator
MTTNAEKLTRASKSERSRRRVLDAAAAEFARNGYASVTLKDIAARAGLQAGSLYYYFDTKEDLVEAILAEGVDATSRDTRAAVGALGANAEPLTRLRVAIAAHLRGVLSEGSYASANLRILGQLPDAIRERHLKQQREYGAFWKALFRAAADAGVIRPGFDLSVLRMLTLGALNWSVEWYQKGRCTPTEIATYAASMIVDGIACDPSRPPVPPKNLVGTQSSE